MREYFDLTAVPPEELRDLQEKELGCLLHLDKICRQNNIRYTLGGGTCIGALREGKFLPWDDDVDVWIPRPDYERLHQIWDSVNDDPHYHLCRNSETECYHINCSFIKDDRGTFINRHSQNEDVNHGIPIDVMVMDAAPANPILRAEQTMLAIVQSIYISQRLPDHQGKVIRVLTHLPLALVRDRKKRYLIWKWCEKRMTRWAWEDCPYAKELTTGFKVKFRKMPREWFDTCKPAMFEGHEVLVAQGAENYMEWLFGDFMTPPPQSDRVAKHNIVYANMDEPYTKFKGTYYCVESNESETEAGNRLGGLFLSAGEKLAPVAKAAGGSTASIAKSVATTLPGFAKSAAGTTAGIAKSTAEATSNIAKSTAKALPDIAKSTAKTLPDIAKSAAGATAHVAKSTAKTLPDIAKSAAGATAGIVKAAGGTLLKGAKAAARTAIAARKSHTTA